jgi:hypothetical protein
MPCEKCNAALKFLSPEQEAHVVPELKDLYLSKGIYCNQRVAGCIASSMWAGFGRSVDFWNGKSCNSQKVPDVRFECDRNERW